MGYSIMVEFPNKDIRDKMLQFLLDNAKSFMDLSKSDLEYVRGPVEDPAYSRDKAEAKGLLIGYDFTGSNHLQSRIAYLFCYWMLKRIPKSKFWYDGDESWPIPEECDEHGFHTLARLEKLTYNRLIKEKNINRLYKIVYGPLIKDMEQFDEPVHTELKRLTGLWNQTN